MTRRSVATFIALVFAFEALISLTSGRLAVQAATRQEGPWSCAHVIKNPSQVRNELVSRNLNGDHKIIKFIENCIKSVDGWRFKKSAPSSQVLPLSSMLPKAETSSSHRSVGSALKSAFSLRDRILPYPVHYVLLGDLLNQGRQRQQMESSDVMEEEKQQPQSPSDAPLLSSSSSSGEFLGLTA